MASPNTSPLETHGPHRDYVYGVVGVALLAYLAVAAASVAYPFDLEMYEGVVLPPALRLAQGKAIYGPGAALSPPYVFPLYGPLYYAVLGALLKIFGVSLWPGRLLSVISSLGLFGLLFRRGHRLGLSRGAALLTASAFLMLPGAWTFFTLQRVDSLSLLLGALGVERVLHERATPARYLSAGLLFAGAALVKPATCGFLLGGFMAFAGKRNWRAAGGLLGSAAIAFLGTVEALRWAGFGDYLFNLVASLDGETSIANVQNLLAAAAGSPLLFVLVTLAVVEVSWLFREARPSYDSAPVMLAVGSAATGTILAVHTGSGINYLLEFFYALCLLAAVSISRGALSTGILAPGLLRTLFMTAFCCEAVVFHGGFFRGRILLPAEKAPLFRNAAALLRKLPPGSPIVTDVADLALRAGLEPYFNDVPQYRLGPAYVRSEFDRFLAERRAAALFLYGEDPFPGYRRVPLGTFSPAPLGRITPTAGPVLYVREDLLSRLPRQSY